MKKLLVVLVSAAALATASKSWAAGGVEGSPHDFSVQYGYSSNTNIGSGTGTGSYTNNYWYKSGTNVAWNTRNGVCTPCHAAHHTDEDQLVPLWNHVTTKSSGFTPYSSPSLNASVGQPTAESLACLSCHDGTVAVNNTLNSVYTNAAAGGVYITGEAQIAEGGNDLHTTHPISFTYDAALATADGQLENPETYHIGDAKTRLSVQTAPVPASWSGTSLTGKTIDEALLFNHQMQCSSCHDPHKIAGSSATSGIMARISGADAQGRGSTLCRTCHVK